MSEGLRTINEQRKLTLWAERVAECRSSGKTVHTWCAEQGICSQTFYKWQKRLFLMAQAQRDVEFAEATPVVSEYEHPRQQDVAITVHISNAVMEIHNGANAAMIESVLRIMESC